MALQAAVDRLGVVISTLCNTKDDHCIVNINHIHVNNEPLVSDIASCNSVQSIQIGQSSVEKSARSSVSLYSRSMMWSKDSLDQIVGREIREILEVAASLIEESNHSNNKSLPAPRKMVSNPQAPPTVLSINHLRIVYTTIELLWLCGVQPFLGTILGDNFEWGEAPHPKSLLLTKESMILLSKTCNSGEDLNQIMCYLRCIHSLVSSPLFSTNMLPRNLRRLLVALLVLAKSDIALSERCKLRLVLNSHDMNHSTTMCDLNEVSILAKDLLESICFQSDDKSFVISELRVASRGPSWMRCAASELFSRIILSDNGFESVLRAYLQGGRKLYLILNNDHFNHITFYIPAYRNTDNYFRLH